MVKKRKTSLKYECELFWSENNKPGSRKPFIKRFRWSDFSSEANGRTKKNVAVKTPKPSEFSSHLSALGRREPDFLLAGRGACAPVRITQMRSPRLAGPQQASGSMKLSQQYLQSINCRLQYYPITLTDRCFHPRRVADIHCRFSGFYWKKLML